MAPSDKTPSAMPAPDRPLPWWREPMLWLVLGGPLAVVVAAIATAVIAVRGSDPVLSRSSEPLGSDTPAVQARNHAATPRPER
ncbi:MULTISPECIES: nitrogen fixation protein FixH [unclassified Methylibium]|uniref:nitrogen fixation protein FixH n=1 Tax=unclassified Methylibium TaxID=2633235 RepID=UPI000AB6E52E|nr:nitrogen fixation protein FixH [Methylibium sp. Root1272]